MSVQMHRNRELDRLRGFAVIMTVLIHYTRIFFPWHVQPIYVHGTTILNLLGNSWTGVDLFFVISGYIISKMITDKIDDLKVSSVNLAGFIKNFYIKRFFRIYPVALVVFIFVLICSIGFNKSGNFSTPENTIEAGISIFTYTFNYYFGSGAYHAFPLSPYWSLSVEEQFYLLLPIFLILTSNHKQRAIIFLGILLVLTFVVRPLSVDNIFFTQNRSDGLIYGCLLYCLSIQPWFLALFSGKGPSRISGILITSALMFFLVGITAIGFRDEVIIPLACIISFLLVGLSTMEKEFITFIPGFQTLIDYFGSRSYSIYLIHLPMFTVAQEIIYRLSVHYHFAISDSLAWEYSVLAFSLALFFSELSYRFIEQPFIAKGRKFIANSTASKTQGNFPKAYVLTNTTN